MADIRDVVDVQITASSDRVSRQGFGVPLVVTHKQLFPERTRVVKKIDDVTDLGYTSADPEYKAISALFSQKPRPPTVLLGRAAGVPTLSWKLVPTVLTSQKYAVVINGVEYSFTSDSSALLAEILAGLETAINAATLTHGLTADDASGTHLVLTASEGAWASLKVTDTTKLSVENTTADPGMAADLAAIKLESNAFYAIHTLFNSKAIISAVAAWAETNFKLYLATSQDSAMENTPATEGATDVGKTLKGLGYDRTSLYYSRDNGNFQAEGTAGRCLPMDPGSETWAHKTLRGVAVETFTPTQVANLEARNINRYEAIAGVSVTLWGKVVSGEYIDIIRFCDWLEARMGERIFGTISAAPGKIPYTDDGVEMLSKEVRATLQQGVTAGGLASDPEPTVTPTKVADADPADRAGRLAPLIYFEGTLAGAIHKAKIRGAVSV